MKRKIYAIMNLLYDVYPILVTSLNKSTLSAVVVSSDAFCLSFWNFLLKDVMAGWHGYNGEVNCCERCNKMNMMRPHRAKSQEPPLSPNSSSYFISTTTLDKSPSHRKFRIQKDEFQYSIY